MTPDELMRFLNHKPAAADADGQNWSDPSDKLYACLSEGIPFLNHKSLSEYLNAEQRFSLYPLTLSPPLVKQTTDVSDDVLIQDKPDQQTHW